MPTREDVENLKHNWAGDPCWDIEDTHGFEAYREELAAYHAEMKAHWAAQRQAKIQAKADELKCSLELAAYILELEHTLDTFNEVMTGLYFRK